MGLLKVFCSGAIMDYIYMVVYMYIQNQKNFFVFHIIFHNLIIIICLFNLKETDEECTCY